MTLIDLNVGPHDRHGAAGAVYLVGIGGPLDETGIGDVSSFRWRFCIVESADDAPTVIGFRSMPSMMAFTRTVNGAQPFSVPTEAYKADLKAIGSAPYRLALDPSPEDFQNMMSRSELVMRSVPELEG